MFDDATAQRPKKRPIKWVTMATWLVIMAQQLQLRQQPDDAKNQQTHNTGVVWTHEKDFLLVISFFWSE